MQSGLHVYSNRGQAIAAHIKFCVKEFAPSAVGLSANRLHPQWNLPKNTPTPKKHNVHNVEAVLAIF